MARTLSGAHLKSLAAAQGEDSKDFVAGIRFADITPHVGQNTKGRRCYTINDSTGLHPAYAQFINPRKRIRRVFGWVKQAAGLRQPNGQEAGTGRSGIPVALGGRQLDLLGQSAQPTGGADMKQAKPADLRKSALFRGGDNSETRTLIQNGRPIGSMDGPDTPRNRRWRGSDWWLIQQSDRPRIGITAECRSSTSQRYAGREDKRLLYRPCIVRLEIERWVHCGIEASEHALAATWG